MHINKVKYEKWISFIYRHKSCYFDHRIEKESFQLENKPDNLTVHLSKILLLKGNLMILIKCLIYSVLFHSHSFNFFAKQTYNNIISKKRVSHKSDELQLTYGCFDFKLKNKKKVSTHKE